MIETTSSYFIGTQDGPEGLITRVKLRGDKQSRSIQIFLKSCPKFGVHDGTISKSTNKQILC